ncbi:MAG: AIR synthase-related protein [Clostridiales bacterium]|nr:AIR synthase-related protein [Clostridiales bacterium]
MRTILVAGSIALGAEDRWMKTREGELRKRFPSFFAYAQRHSPHRVGWDQVRQAVEAHGSWTDPVRSGALGCLRELASARRSHPPLIRPSDGTVFLPMGRDGFFAALWALNELCGCGCDIDLEAVPVRQETIEFCEYFGADPYGEDSSGAVMLAAEDGEALLAGLLEEGVPASRIGFQTKRRAGVIRCRGRVRCLDRPPGW